MNSIRVTKDVSLIAATNGLTLWAKEEKPSTLTKFHGTL